MANLTFARQASREFAAELIGTMRVDIGQNIVEEVSPVAAGANLGWNVWEGSYRYVSQRAVISESPRSDPNVTYPIVEWGQLEIIQEKNRAQGKMPAARADLRFDATAAGRMFLLNKADGTIRVVER